LHAKGEPLVPSAVGAKRLSIGSAWTAVSVALLVVVGLIALALVRR
jgi:hypothetical protein